MYWPRNEKQREHFFVVVRETIYTYNFHSLIFHWSPIGGLNDACQELISIRPWKSAKSENKDWRVSNICGDR